MVILGMGCNRQAGQGGTGSEGDSGTNTSLKDNGKVYDRGGTEWAPGSGRIDQGGGITGGGTNSITWTNAATGQTNPGPQVGRLPGS